MEPYVLIVHLAANLWNPSIPPQTFVQPSQGECLRQARRLKEFGHRTQCLPENDRALDVAR